MGVDFKGICLDDYIQLLFYWSHRHPPYTHTHTSVLQSDSESYSLREQAMIADTQAEAVL